MVRWPAVLRGSALRASHLRMTAGPRTTALAPQDDERCAADPGPSVASLSSVTRMERSAMRGGRSRISLRFIRATGCSSPFIDLKSCAAPGTRVFVCHKKSFTRPALESRMVRYRTAGQIEADFIALGPDRGGLHRPQAGDGTGRSGARMRVRRLRRIRSRGHPLPARAGPPAAPARPPDPPLRPGAHPAGRRGGLGAPAVLNSGSRRMGRPRARPGGKPITSRQNQRWVSLRPTHPKRAHRIGPLGLLWWARCVLRLNPP